MTKKLFAWITAIALTAATLTGCASGIFGGGSAERSLVINEVVTSNSYSLRSDVVGSPDWIELYNGTGGDIDLAGYVIAEAGTNGKACELTSGTVAAGGYFLLFACDVPDAETEYPCTGFRISKNGCSLVLKNTAGVNVDTVTVPELTTDISWGRNDGGEFTYYMIPTPGAQNSGPAAASLEEIAGLSATPGLEISEACADWVELHNTTQGEIYLTSYCLTENPGNLEKWRFPNVPLAADGYFVVRMDGTGEVSTDFFVGKDEDTIYLTMNGETVDSLPVAGLAAGMSSGRDANGSIIYFSTQTPGAPNSGTYFDTPGLATMSDSAAVIINELLAKNKTSVIDENGDRSEWAELWNRSAADVNLSDYCLSDNADDPYKWRLPDTALPAGGFAVIFLDGKDTGMHAGFRLGAGESIYLTDTQALTRQEVMMADECRLDDISYGLKDGAWLYFGKPTPGRANTTHGESSVTSAASIEQSGIWINEVSATAAIKSDKKDWVEIYNAGGEVSLDGWYLTNDIDEPQKFALSGSLGGGEYKLVYASAKPSQQSGGTAPFGISQGGERLYLFDSEGYVADSFETGALKLGVTSGRAADDTSGQRVFFTEATPGKANAAPVAGLTTAPVFSRDGGYCTEPVTVEITGSGSIYYTTDGSHPTTASAQYTGPIEISKTTVLKAVSKIDGGVVSDQTVATYLFAQPHSLPVVCLSSSPDDFTAVYAAVEKFTDVERECYFEYYDADGSLGTSFPAGFRVSGASTRVYPQKSFNVYCRGAYGQSSVTYPFFPGYSISTFKSLNLRNGGQDCYYDRATDAYASMLTQDMDIDAAQSRFVVVYINGSYWGIYDLKENQNEDFFAARHGLDPDNINVIRRNQTRLSGEKDEILRVRELASHTDMSVDANYEKLAQWVDTQEFMDYLIASTYCDNSDMFNQKYWRDNDYAVKWRLIFFDLDFCFQSQTRSLLSAYFNPAGNPSHDGTITNTDIQAALKQNAGWRDAFIERYAYHINNTFADSLALYDKMIAEIAPEMQRHIDKWHFHSSMSDWEGDVAATRKVVENRSANMKKNLKSYFGLSDERMAELFPEGQQ